MIVDSVEGIYQNTLTIAQSVTGDSLYGLYSCMVENSRGSSNRTVYFYGKSFILVDEQNNIHQCHKYKQQHEYQHENHLFAQETPYVSALGG